jgi:hypothetical protein
MGVQKWMIPLNALLRFRSALHCGNSDITDKDKRPRMKILNVFANILLLAITHLTLAFFKSSCTGQDKK